MRSQPARSVSVFSSCALHGLGGLCGRCCMGRSRWTSSPEHVRVTSVLTSSGELALPACPAVGDLPKAVQTCLIRPHNRRARCSRGRGELQMTIMMPASDQAVLDRRETIVSALRAIVPGEGVIDSAAEMLPYESDGLTAYRQPPMVVVLPDTTAQVSQVLKYCFEQGIKVVPRGAGTSLSGGALPLADGLLLGLGKFKRIREIDFDNRVVVTEPGVTNLAISQAVAHAGFYYAPDPSSQIACSIGGNVAENSGGVHCLKYGMTTNNVLGCEIVLMSGEIIRIGGKACENSGYDLMGIITGSEGLLGIITEITVRILQKPETARALMVGFAEVE